VKDVTPVLRIGSVTYSWVSDDTPETPWGAPFHIALTPPRSSERVVTFCGLAFPVKEIRDSITLDRACAICKREFSRQEAK
jgi:hypothetical protein